MMSNTTQNGTADHGEGTQSSAQAKRPHLTKMQQLNKLYELPAPLRIFPLPTLIPHNPVSLLHILYVWVSQTLQRPSSHFDTPYCGWFSPDTRSVHVTDSRSIRGLWEQGFYGKGTLSRSEPNWLNREKNLRGTKAKATSEEVTRNFRVQRQQKKWERARKEREAIEQKLVEEAKAEADLATKTPRTETTASTYLQPPFEHQGTSIGMKGYADSLSQKPRVAMPPTGPKELLSLPNSFSDMDKYFSCGQERLCESTDSKDPADYPDDTGGSLSHDAPVGPLQLLALRNSDDHSISMQTSFSESVCSVGEEPANHQSNGHVQIQHQLGTVSHHTSKSNGIVNGLRVYSLSETAEVGFRDIELKEDDVSGSSHSDDTTDTKCYPRAGSVLANGSLGTPKIKRSKSVRFSPTVEKNTFIQSEPPSPEKGATSTVAVEEGPSAIRDQEHFQLTMEEAFFLSYALGALTIFDSTTKAPIPNQELISLFRKTSYYPPHSNPSLSSDDPFMINYVVYHHFRSLGWVVRGGIKFSMDYMLYNRGPVFSHAEFGVIILPSYRDPYWSSDVFLQNYVRGKEKRSWSWLHCINRVITQVKKTLVIVYVDIPKPLDAAEEGKLGIDGTLARYKVREFVLKRWSANRMRD